MGYNSLWASAKGSHEMSDPGSAANYNMNIEHKPSQQLTVN